MYTIAVLLATCGVLTQATPPESRLVTDLFAGYEKSNSAVVPPSKSFDVQFGLTLVRADFDSDEETISGNFFQVTSWTDSRLKWDPQDYDGLTDVRVPSSFVWKPDIVLYNSVDGEKVDENVNVVVYSSGLVLWVPKTKVKVDCPVDDSNVCSADKADCAGSKGTCTATFRYGSWTFDGNRLNPQFYKDLEAIDISEYKDRKGLRLVSTSAKKNVKKYDCCEEPYPNLEFKAVFELI